MPRAEDIFDARRRVNEWYYDYIREQNPDFTPVQTRYVVQLTPYLEKLKKFVEKTGAYTGPYSCY
jgi:hypothetical protein